MAQDIRIDEQGELHRVAGRADPTFVGSLSFHDLQRLRAVVKRQYMKFYPVDHFTDREADALIESIGRQTAERLVKRAVDGKEGKAGWL